MNQEIDNPEISKYHKKSIYQEKSKKRRLAAYISIIILFLACVVFLTFRYGPKLSGLVREPDVLSKKLNSYGWKGIIVFMGIQALQVILAAIPGEFVQIAGGYVYGTWLGTLYSLAGIVAGSVLAFFIARLLGFPVVKMLVSEKQLEKFNFMMKSRKSDIAMFILFLIPGIPKDVLTYIAGLTPVRPLKFFIIITAGRFPALLASSYIGHSTQKGNYAIAVALLAAAAVLFIAGLLLKDRIIHKLSKRAGETDR